MPSQPQAQQAAPAQLKPCPDSPNCVLSTAVDGLHSIAPFPLRGSAEASLLRLAGIINDLPRTKIVLQTATYLHAEFTSLIFRFTDDVEFLCDANAPVVQVRSASRIGYGDLGANRKRVEELRAAYLSAK